MKIGLYFGSFNPIHIGHLAIANYMLEWTDIDQLWFVISPLNPLKKKASLLEDFHRLELVNIAIAEYDKFRVSNIEFNLPKPSYTIDTLTYLKEKHPDFEFKLILGSDNLEYFHKWKNNDLILQNYDLLVYPRPGFQDNELLKLKNVTLVTAPLMEISSSFIRESIKEKKDITFFLPHKVYRYILDMHFYEK